MVETGKSAASQSALPMRLTAVVEQGVRQEALEEMVLKTGSIVEWGEEQQS